MDEKKKKKQQILQRNSQEYKTIDRTIQNKRIEEKSKWLNKKCEEIEHYKNIDSVAMHRKIREIADQKSCQSAGCIKSKDGKIIMEKERILEGWTEYIGELFSDNRGEKTTIMKQMEGPKILKSELKAAMSKMKRNKAARPDEITTEMLQALDEFGIEKLTELIDIVYDSGKFLMISANQSLLPSQRNMGQRNVNSTGPSA